MDKITHVDATVALSSYDFHKVYQTFGSRRLTLSKRPFLKCPEAATPHIAEPVRPYPPALLHRLTGFICLQSYKNENKAQNKYEFIFALPAQNLFNSLYNPLSSSVSGKQKRQSTYWSASNFLSIIFEVALRCLTLMPCALTGILLLSLSLHGVNLYVHSRRKRHSIVSCRQISH